MENSKNKDIKENNVEFLDVTNTIEFLDSTKTISFDDSRGNVLNNINESINDASDISKRKLNNIEKKHIPYIIGACASIVIIGIILILLSIKFNATEKINYSENSDLDYKVYLNPNDYYEQPYLTKDNVIIASLIKNIDTTFKYSFTTSDKINLNGTYSIVANFMITDSSGNTILSKKENIVENEKLNKISSTTLNVNKNISIDYNKYNQMAKDFISKYSLQADAKVEFKLITNIDGKHSEYTNKLSKNNSIILTVPLNKSLFNIDMDYKLSNNDNQVLQYKYTEIRNMVLFIIGCILVVISTVICIYVIVKCIKNKDAIEKYNSAIKKIMSENSEYLGQTYVTESVDKLMETTSLRIILVKTFEDFMDIRNNLRLPIQYQKEDNGLVTVFYIFTETIGYIYILKASDFSDSNKEEKIKKEI